MTLLGSCVRKARYRTEQFAREIADRCKAERGVELRTYWCGACGGYHLTREPSALERHESTPTEDP